MSPSRSAFIDEEGVETGYYQDDLHGSPEDFYVDERFRHSEDIECWIRSALNTDWKIEALPRALTLYRLNAGGRSASPLKQLES